MHAPSFRISRGAFAALLAIAGAALLQGSAPSQVRAATVPTVPIAQYPLTVAVPAHPQVLFAIGNSESMDGNLSGAIMTGSGSLGANYTGLNGSSSPVDFTVPAGFTPPVSGGAVGSSQPYTVSVSGHWVDNSPSRLNVAKGGLTQILSDYMEYADFGLLDYAGGGATLYTTWVYEMSPTTGDFTFATTAGTGEVLNPCYLITQDTANSVDYDCRTLAGRYGSLLLKFNQYMNVSASSDDPDVNDILYVQGTPGDGSTICLANGPPGLTSYTLAGYEAGNVRSSYGSGCFTTTAPTNAGFVPSSHNVMYIARGWAYGSGQTANSGSVVVGMTSAGAIPTPASVATAIANFTPYLAPETNVSTSGEIKAQTGQSPVAGLLAKAASYYSTVKPASNNGCTPTRYVVLVTDGLPTMDLNGNNWPPLGTKPASDFGVTASFNADNSLNTTNDGALNDVITELKALQSLTTGQGGAVKTYVIGVGAGVDPDSNPTAAATLTAMAIAGGTGAYWPASSAADLSNDMQAILAQILKETAATSASAINSTGISTTSVAYQGTFTTSDTYEDWTGNLLAYKIDATTGYINTAYSAASWQAQVQLDAQDWTSPSRLITTWDPVTSKGIPFRWDSNTSATSGIASSTALGQALETFPNDTNGQDVLEYLRGRATKEQRAATPGPFRSRTHKLGDIIDSSPLYVGAPSGPWQDVSYIQFEGKYINRQPMIYIGANDGMLHAFNATTGNEVFAYIPHAVFSNLIKLVNPYYNPQHQFYVDGTPQAADVQFASDSSWHTVLMGSERAGGNSIFAIDVTDPSVFTNENSVADDVLWEFTDANMGDTFSVPQAVSTAAGFAVMFGNGYNSPTSKPFFYALDPQAGTVMAKIDLCAAVPSACNASLPNGLSNIVATNTQGALLAGHPNVVYAGDLQGNLWRIDISSASPSAWTVSVLFKATDRSGNAQPITVTPAVTLNPLFPSLAGDMVYFGTGQFLGLPDLGTTQIQTVYGVFDGGTAPATPYTRSNLAVQTLSEVTSVATMSGSNAIRQLSNNPVNLPSVRGWYVDLDVTGTSGAQLDPGERVVTDPTLFNGTLQITTYQPNPNTCVGGGNAWYLVFNYATGGSTTLPQFDWYGSGTINNNDLYMNQTVAGMSLGNSYAAAPKMVTMGDQAVVYTTQGTAQVGGLCNNTSCDTNTLNADQLARGAWQEIR
ncbi:MAG TPA: PilC/PilY family type IV pilus protein [Steroidobacteraceae bacterium]|nr:PilC/PilY family type IV pilus protein [Steroidobacteraceae bacterium]